MTIVKFLAPALGLAVAACGPTLLDTQITSSVAGLNAWGEYRTVSYDGVNRTVELWGVNRSDQRVCLGFRPEYGGWQAFELPPGKTMKLLSLGQTPGTGTTRMGYDLYGAACEPSLFIR